MKKIHIAEDEVEISGLLSSFFKRKGFEVSLSKNAEEAMQAIENEIPDFAVLDLFLEGEKNGLDILKYIKEKYPSIKTIVASGIIEGTIKAEMNGCKPDIFLQKPYSLEDLFNKIKILCQ
jgi:two-component system response regulator HydG